MMIIIKLNYVKEERIFGQVGKLRPTIIQVTEVAISSLFKNSFMYFIF